MPQRVLPSSSVLPVIGEPIGDEFVDLGQRQHLVPRRPYRHRCQRDVRIWRLLVAVSVPRRSRHLFPSRIPLNPSRLRFLPLPLDRIPLVSFLPSFFFPSHLSSTVPHIPSRSLSLSLSPSCKRRYRVGALSRIIEDPRSAHRFIHDRGSSSMGNFL